MSTGCIWPASIAPCSPASTPSRAGALRPTLTSAGGGADRRRLDSGLVGLSGSQSRAVLVRLPSSLDGLQDAHPVAGQGDDDLAMSLALTAFPVVEGPAGRATLNGAQRRLVEDAFRGPDAAGGALQIAKPDGPLQGRSQRQTRRVWSTANSRRRPTSNLIVTSAFRASVTTRRSSRAWTWSRIVRGHQHPVKLLRHIGTHRQHTRCTHSDPPGMQFLSAVRGLCLQSLIGGQEKAAGRAAKRPEPYGDSKHQSHTRLASTVGPDYHLRTDYGR